MKGNQGTSMGGAEWSPRRRQRDAKRRRRQEAAWVAKAGPVQTWKRCASCGERTAEPVAWPGGDICLACVPA
jgi:hypothetical protein